ncbi:MAG: alpha amylase C-terminal domain-containing protein [Clostridia bacterium]|nr:alpha amylase C-terminal domain-containing protein [Clostridia bacterium]
MLTIDLALANLAKRDPHISPYLDEVRLHLERYNLQKQALCGKDTHSSRKTLSDVTNGHMYFGFHRTDDGWVFREWLPGADAAWLTGDFNDWEKFSHPLTDIGGGVWEITLDGWDALRHEQFVKLIVGRQGSTFERIPAYIRRTVQDPVSHKLCGQIWDPAEPFVWTDEAFRQRTRTTAPRIYESHIGMAQEKPGVGTYTEFADVTLDWIAESGYNTIQLMAIAEHPYYASFGYQVTGFFAPSSWFGTPDELKYLINRAHEKGIAVLLDVVHSHACPNVGEGLYLQDGTETQYFHAGARGWHPAWETRCFDYGRGEVLHFLLSNLKYWLEEFHFDGFRFDGVTSMLYEDHGLGTAFTDYRQYFSMNTNVDARVYLMLANELVHEVHPAAITIAEDMSGMPGMALPLTSGGLGFDYRLSMGVPDLWIKLIKEKRFEDWNVFELWHELTGGRPGERSICYAESHDQALVGDKTIMFRLADAEMYDGMNRAYHSPVMDTAIDFHKLIRFAVAALGNGGYLNFMGNEFGHPEWIDFPREGNGWSFHHARRQWSLVRDPFCKFEWLSNFDRALMALLEDGDLLSAPKAEPIWLDEQKNLLIWSRGGKTYAVNMHPTTSQQHVFIYCPNDDRDYRVVFSSDEKHFGGQGRISLDTVYTPKETPHGNGFFVYLPCRCALVLEPIKSKRTAKSKSRKEAFHPRKQNN